MLRAIQRELVVERTPHARALPEARLVGEQPGHGFKSTGVTVVQSRIANKYASATVMDAARAGMGVAVLSEWVALGYVERGDLVVRRLAKGPLQRPWRIAYRDECSAVATRQRAALIGLAPRLSAVG